MRNTEQAPACVDCDWTGFRQVLVFDGKARTIYAAPCDCARGRAISHPMVPDAKLSPPPAFSDFANMHRRKGHEVMVTDRHEPRIPLAMSNPEAWERAKGHLRANPKNPYRTLVDSWQYIEDSETYVPEAQPTDQKRQAAADWNTDDEPTVVEDP